MAESGELIELILAAIVFLLLLPVLSQLVGIGNVDSSQVVGLVRLLVYVLLGIVFLNIVSDILD